MVVVIVAGEQVAEDKLGDVAFLLLVHLDGKALAVVPHLRRRSTYMMILSDMHIHKSTSGSSSSCTTKPKGKANLIHGVVPEWIPLPSSIRDAVRVPVNIDLNRIHAGVSDEVVRSIHQDLLGLDCLNSSYKILQ